MTSDLDIFRTANVLVKPYGEDAAIEAAQRANAMLEKGSVDGQRVWKRVMAAEAESSIGGGAARPSTGPVARTAGLSSSWLCDC